MILSDEDKKSLPPLYSTEKTPDPIVQIKLFVPWNNWTWFVTEGQEEEGDFRMFGLACGHENELGYFCLSEMEGITGPGGLKIEKDIHFKPKPLSEVRASL
jgi:hypothetical protein